MTLWIWPLPASLLPLFLSAAVGISGPLFWLPGLLHRRADEQEATLAGSLRYAVVVLACALPGFLAAQAIVRLSNGSRAAGVCLAPLALAALAGAIDRLPRLIPALKPRWIEAAYGGDRLRLYVLASALALLPAYEPALQTAPFLRSAVYFAGSGCGLLLASAVLGAIGERLGHDTFPAWMRGTPAILVATGLVTWAWMAMNALFTG